MSTKDIKNAAESLKMKAQARSEDIEGTIREKLGEFSDDQESIKHGRAKQEKAEEIREEADKK